MYSRSHAWDLESDPGAESPRPSPHYNELTWSLSSRKQEESEVPRAPNREGISSRCLSKSASVRGLAGPASQRSSPGAASLLITQDRRDLSPVPLARLSITLGRQPPYAAALTPAGTSGIFIHCPIYSWLDISSSWNATLISATSKLAFLYDS